MTVWVGVVLLLIGLLSSMYLLISAYKELKKETKTSNKVLFFISSFFEMLNPGSLSGFAFMLSLVAIIIGLALITELFH